MTCVYCGDAKRIQIVSPVSDHAWADCFCVKLPALSAQQAAGEAEAVRLREIAKPFDDLMHWIRQNEPDYLNPAQEVQLEDWAYTLGIDEIMAAASLANSTPQPTETRMPCPDLLDRSHSEAVDWITANCTAIRRDNGDMDYSLGAMIAAYEAGKAQPTETQRIVAIDGEREGPAPIPNTRLQCFGCKHLHTEDWREPSGDGETYDRGTTALCKAKGGQVIGCYWSRTNDAPKWCPFLPADPASGEHLAGEGQ
jgi:hypothetical protein